MKLSDDNRLKGHIPPLIAAAVIGLGFAVFAIVSQDGFARGYASIGLLFVTAGLAILGFIAGIVALALGRAGTAFELIGSTFILPATFLLLLFVVRTINGE
jgi:hypothetical protein